MQKIAQALCHLLIQSLWLGLFLAILTCIIILLTRKSAAALRYRLLAGILVLYTSVITLIFVIDLNSRTSENIKLPGVPATGHHNFIFILISHVNDVLKYAHEHAEMVIGFWLVAVGLQHTRLLFGFYILYRLKKVQVKPAGKRWQEKLNNFCHTLGITKTVLLLESAIAWVPLLIGYLKPVVLIPIGLVNYLQPEQVEAILLHELAHVLRKDYLVNMLQTVLESFFFFNPAVLWLSGLIRSERENCCDDVAISYTQNHVEYYRTLLYFEEYRLRLPKQALALSGTRISILNRLERIITGRNRSLGMLDLVILVVTLVLSTVLIGSSPQLSVRSLLNKQDSGVFGRNDLEIKKKAEAAATARKQGTDHIP